MLTLLSIQCRYISALYFFLFLKVCFQFISPNTTCLDPPAKGIDGLASGAAPPQVLVGPFTGDKHSPAAPLSSPLFETLMYAIFVRIWPSYMHMPQLRCFKKAVTVIMERLDLAFVQEKAADFAPSSGFIKVQIFVCIDI